MALTGTLEDFGLSAILQLIGQQAKSGVLHLEGGGESVRVLISDGCVVSAEHTGRKRCDRLGAMLVRAGLVTPEDLERALDVQRRTLRRLGEVLIELGLLSRGDLRQMTALQTTETVFALFTWKSGTYAFEAGAIDVDAEAVAPLAAEMLLMEGFRRVDEWPLLRRRIPSPATTFVRVRRGASSAAAEALSDTDRKVLALVEEGRTAERIADLSRLGEFDAYRALVALMNAGLVNVASPSRRSAAAGISAWLRGMAPRVGRALASVGATAGFALAVAAAGILAADRIDARGGDALDGTAAERLLARSRLARLSGALELWRLEHGAYPEQLAALADDGLVARCDLRTAHGEDYHYRRNPEGGFVLLPPLP